MVRRVRVGAVVTLLTAVVVGPAGCSDVMDLDPPSRILYEGPYEDAVVLCARNTLSFADVTDHPAYYSEATNIVVRAPREDAEFGMYWVSGTSTNSPTNGPKLSAS